MMKAVISNALLQQFQEKHQHLNVVMKINQIVIVKGIVVAIVMKVPARVDENEAIDIGPKVDLVHLSARITVLKAEADDHLLLLDDKLVRNQVIDVDHLLLVQKETVLVPRKNLLLLQPLQLILLVLVLKRKHLDPIEKLLALIKSLHLALVEQKGHQIDQRELKNQKDSKNQRDLIKQIEKRLAEKQSVNYFMILIVKLPMNHQQNEFQPKARMKNHIIILILHQQLQQ
jgi:hypothetical protein